MASSNPYVFISYAHKNSDKVFPAIKEMQAQGIELWYDNGIIAGSEWPEFVAEKVANCDKFVLFVSDAYLDSQNCKRELNFAISRRKDILSIFLEDVNLSPGMEMQLGTYQAIFRNRFPGDQQFYQALPTEPFFDSCKEAGSGQTNTAYFQASTPPRQEPPVRPATPPKQEIPFRTDNSVGSATWINDNLPQKSKAVAILLTLFLGFCGIHKFYLRKPLLGILYLAFCWTYVPAVLALIDLITMLCQSNEKLSKKYRCRFI